MSAISGYYAPAGQGWRLAYSLVTLAHELAQVYGDTLTCLGTVGDVAHAAEAMGSDHNPFIRDPGESSVGIVRAIDFGGPDAVLKQIRQHIWGLYAGTDPRVYVFGYGKGCSDNLINNWGLPFKTHVDTGDAGHLHISVTQLNGYNPSPSGYVSAIDSTAAWGFAGLEPSGGGTLIGDLSMADAASLQTQITALANQVGSFRNETITQFDTAVVPALTQIAQQIAALPTAVVAALPASSGGGLTIEQVEAAVTAAVQAITFGAK